MQHNQQLMSEEGGGINENTNLSSDEEVPPTEHEAAPGMSEPENEIESPMTEAEGGTEESLGGQGQQLETSTFEQPSPQLEPEAKPQKQMSKATINKIQKSLVDTSNLLVKQRTQINKINRDLQSLQKQMKAGERQTGMVNQIRSQVNQIQKQISQVHKNVQKRSGGKLQSGKKVSGVKMKDKKKNKK
jgi:small-conductance mechanosensitive channel